MKKQDLMKYVGRQVCITLDNGKCLIGKLGYTEEFSSEFNFRKPKCFTLGNWDFKVSHVRHFSVLED